jgi:hypothetical protein
VTCGAKTSTGRPCKNLPLEGTNRCRHHGGASPQAQAKAVERLALARAQRTLESLGQTEPVSDPITALEELAGQAVALVDVLRGAVSRLEQIRYRDDRVGEQIRGELQAYLSALARAESILGKIISLDLASRRLALDEARVLLVVNALGKVLGARDLDLTAEQQRRARALIARELGAPAVVIDGTAEEVSYGAA